MDKTTALLTCLLLSAASLRAEPPPADKDAAAAAPDVITPLNVRDPSALVMGPGGEPVKGLSFATPSRPPSASAAEAKVAKSAVDKTGVRSGERAVSLSIDEDQLLGVKPGDRVDILAVFDAADAPGSADKLAATMLQNVRVLGVATTGDLRGKGVLTLELNPLEAQYALLGVRQADLGVAVRAPDDVELHPYEMASFRRFFR